MQTSFNSNFVYKCANFRRNNQSMVLSQLFSRPVVLIVYASEQRTCNPQVATLILTKPCTVAITCRACAQSMVLSGSLCEWICSFLQGSQWHSSFETWAVVGGSPSSRLTLSTHSTLSFTLAGRYGCEENNYYILAFGNR